MVNQEYNKKINGKYPSMLRGLQGICDLLGCSMSKATQLANGRLAPACKRDGKRFIRVDTYKALQILGFENAERFIEESSYQD